jgi:hypothetical protein
MADWHRTRLEKKYKAIKLLAISQRYWGSRFIPYYTKVARDLKMTPQNLEFMWNNRKAIEERANRILPRSIRKSIEDMVLLRLTKEANNTLLDLKEAEYDEMSISQFIKAFDSLTDVLIKIKLGL